MQFSFKFVAAVAFILPNLLNALPTSLDSLDKRDAPAEATAFSDIAPSPRDTRFNQEADELAVLGRDVHAAALQHIEVSVRDLERRAYTKSDLATVTASYKKAQRDYATQARAYKAEKNPKKKGIIAAKIVSLLTK